jgi:predicted acylesterase/phospholipase RssA
VARTLALVHPPSADRPAGTPVVADAVGIDHVVHLRDGSDDDLARLARLATGHGVGLVLGGGGARGFAHLGAYRALRESGVPIDAVVACSIGAPLAGGIAQDVPLDSLDEVAEAQFHKLLDYTVPVVALLKGERISTSIGDRFGTWDIQDLWLPYACVSTNLTRARLEVHRRGDASKAIRASVAIPGVLPPVPHDGDLLVDGAVLDNLPIGVLRDDASIGTIIAIDVAPPQGPRAKTDFGTSMSGTRALLAAVTGRGGSYPRASAVLMRSMFTGSAQRQREALDAGVVDLLLSLHLPGVGLLEFENVREVSAAGYEAALPEVRRWAADRPWMGGPT